MHARSRILLLSALALLSPPASADFQSAQYFGGSPVAGAGVQCNTACFPNGPPMHVGGYEFRANGQVPAFVFVEDQADVGVYATACQDADADGFCGEAGEPMVGGCAGVLELKGFRSDLNTLVFVYSTRVSGGTCVGLATTGFITLMTKPA